jgi:replicative DNA helicase
MAERRHPPERKVPSDKGLPVNLDAERFVLGSIMLEPEKYTQAAANLQPESFSLRKHQLIFQRMRDLHDRSQPIDRVSVANELLRNNELGAVDGLGYLVSLDDGLPKIVNLGGYISIVREKATLRRTIFSAQKLINRCMLDDLPSALRSDAEDVLLALGESDQDSGPQTPRDIIQALPGGVNEFLGPPKEGLKTRFYKLDEMTGGFHSGEFIILAARPGAGKTALALNLAQHAAQKYDATVMFFSLEMSKIALLHRLTCAIARVDSQRVRLNYLNQDERRSLAKAVSELAQLNLYIDDKSAATPADLHARIKRQKARGPVDMVIVDYLQLMAAGKKFENRNQEVTYLSRGLKLLAQEIEAPVIALSQLSRAPESRKGKARPQLSDLRDSGSLEQDADLVLFIYRDELYNPGRGDNANKAELIIGKQRSGPIGTIHLNFLHQSTRFDNPAEDRQEPLSMRVGKDASSNDDE